ALLLGLVVAAGLTREVLWSAGPRAHHRLNVLTAPPHLPGRTSAEMNHPAQLPVWRSVAGYRPAAG
ncbi:hypothetical protein AB0B98_31850, partial [Micromonospora sp. NPDC048947]